ncbi:acetyl-CoA carboxylase biotin carboxylase subunit [bacterium]|nr:acetyl-CoA carboxylase biotin carboxylase subunit [bacterium]MBT3581761.1 acetyl-CoA carboxylase biotin carboxylase subunit [bacterium]MBT5988123.1 acetyl-CoA carboxylase biotin carboxylase subunit [bacterium]
MFKKVLIANRGEIAIRIIRACKELDCKTVAIYSEADKESLHVKLADESYCIGPALPSKSYLNIPAIISVAEVSGADALHPGYGFLSESAYFSELCQDHKITFIGPSPQNISLMGDKSQAKITMRKFNVPVVPGSVGVIKSEQDLESVAKKTGYPLLIKAVAGGGGKGMRIVTEQEQLIEMYNIAVAEALSAFNNGEMYVEKYIEEPRHIEIQILSDKKGNAIHLGERDCSIQRRHQKLIEESPSPFLDAKLREKMGAAAVAAAKGIKYQGAGTIEFVVDKKKNFYFIEMNTRIQVEHPVTEMVTNVDLIKEQIKIAATGKLTLKQSDIKLQGHALEMRINAEDYQKNFMPCPGKIKLYLPSGGIGVRVDSHLYQGYTVPPNYDSLLGKLIVWGKDRQEALKRAERALDEFVIDGLPTTIPFHQLVLKNEKFRKGDFDTSFIAKNF